MNKLRRNINIFSKKIPFLIGRYLSITSIWMRLPQKIKILIKKIFKLKKFPNYSKLRDLNLNKSTIKKNFHFGTIIGNHNASNLLDSSIAKYLTLRGHKVSVLLCDESLPACLNCSIWKSSSEDRTKDDLTKSPKEQDLCKSCYGQAYDLWKKTNAKVYKISELISKNELKKINQQIKKLKLLEKVFFNDLDITEDIIAGCLRYLCKGNENIISKNLYKRYTEAALTICYCYEKIILKESIDVGIWVHGIYVPHGILNKIFKKKQITFYNYNTSYRENRFYFTKNQTYHKQFPNEKEKDLKLKKTSKKEINFIKDYLRSREKGTQDWQQFNNNPEASPDQKLKALGYKFDDRDLAILYTNVVWDARLHFQENLYPSMIHWLEDTINYFKLNKDKKLIIRVHPGELISHSVSRERVEDLECTKDLPENIILINPKSRISSYYLASISNINILFATKLAMELSIYNNPIICCGDAWVKGKGATIDPKSVKEYKQLLNSDWHNLKQKYSSFLGLAYSYYFFEKKPVYFPFFQVSGDRKSFNINLKRYKKELIKNDSVLRFIEYSLLNKIDIKNK